MRSLINGTTLTIDQVHNPDDVSRIVRLAMTAGLTTIEMRYSGDDGMTINVAPALGAFAADPLASLLYVVAEVQGTTPEKLIEVWRTKTGVSADATGQTP